MDNIQTVLTALASAKTPLTAGAIIAALAVTVIWRLAAVQNLDKSTRNLIIGGGYGITALALVLGLAGYLWQPRPLQQQQIPPVAVFGSVYGDAAKTVPVKFATVTITPDADSPPQIAGTGPNGEFHSTPVALPPGTTIRVVASADGYQTAAQDVAYAMLGKRVQLVLTPKPVLAGHPLANHVPPNYLLHLPAAALQYHPPAAAAAQHVPAAQFAMVMQTPNHDWNALFAADKGDELKLANVASDAFAQGQYAVTLRFLEQAQAVSSSGVWKSSYPKLAASYYLTGDPAKGRAALARMLADITHDVNGSGYLGWKTTLGFVLRDMSDAEGKLDPSAKADFDGAFDKVMALRTTARA